MIMFFDSFPIIPQMVSRQKRELNKYLNAAMMIDEYWSIRHAMRHLKWNDAEAGTVF